MEGSRREFLKKALGTGAAVAATSTVAMASGLTSNNITDVREPDSNGVVVGKSPKKEILYKETKAWDDFYKSSY